MPEMEVGVNHQPMPPFIDWVKKCCTWPPDGFKQPIIFRRGLLCSRPFQTMTRYTHMKAYDNHFRVEDSKNNSMQTFDSGIVSLFDMLTLGARDFSLNFVGVLKYILKLDYGCLHTPMVNFRCEWIKQENTKGNPTYVRDDVSFLTVNFHHKFPLSFEPFIFPCQTTQMTSRSQVGKLCYKKKFDLGGRR
jgi:hypothetical protein